MKRLWRHFYKTVIKCERGGAPTTYVKTMEETVNMSAAVSSSGWGGASPTYRRRVIVSG